ncbi:MAG: type II toxin-antitoxin system HicB family antitoxin [Myxococcales bacterium]
MRRYTVRYERDEAGWWTGEIKEVQGCRTQGRTIAQVRKRIRDALGLFVNNAKTAALIDDVVLPTQARRTLVSYQQAREKAEKESARAQASTLQAVRVLTQRLGLSTRDASELLGLSHQRIQQLAHEHR